MLKGYKTYIVGTAAIAVGIYLEINVSGSGLDLIFLGLGFMGVRNGISNTQDISE